MVLEAAASVASPDFLITAWEAFHVASEAEYHEWIMGGPDRVWGTRAARRGVRPETVGPPGQIDGDATPAVARIDAGVWLADCPGPRCNSAMTLVREARGFMCGDCFNADVPGRRYRPLEWPEAQTIAAVERALLDGRRPELLFIFWRPGVSLAELDAEGPFHHSFTAYKTYSVGAVGTAAERNTYERDNGNEGAAAKAAAAGDLFVGTAANALTALAIGAAGQQLVVNPGATAPEWGGELVILKASDQTVNNNDTLQDDDDFAFAVEANSVYAVRALLLISSGATPDFKLGWTLPASATLRGLMTQLEDGANAEIATFEETTSQNFATTTGTGQLAHILTAVIITAGSSGTAQLQWAQNVADVSDTKVLANSWMMHRKVG